MNDEKTPQDNDERRGVAKSAQRAERATAPKAVSEAERRRLRAAQKLRENLQRRKQQQRSRRSGLADETEGLPAAGEPGEGD